MKPTCSNPDLLHVETMIFKHHCQIVEIEYYKGYQSYPTMKIPFDHFKLWALAHYYWLLDEFINPFTKQLSWYDFIESCMDKKDMQSEFLNWIGKYYHKD